MPRSVALQKQLDALLGELFTPEELHRFLAYYERGGDFIGDRLVNELVSPRVPPAEFSFEAATLIVRWGLLDEHFLEALRQHRPAQADAIALLSPAQRTRPAPAARPVPTSDNPFTPFRLFEGREAERAQLIAHLRIGRSTLLIGGRRSGKTALSRELTEATLERVIVRADVASWLPDSEETIRVEMARLLAAADPSRAALEAALAERKPVTFILDEADRLLQHPWSGSFLAWLRALDDSTLRGDISFLLIGGPALAHFKNPSDGGSPPLNTSEPVYLDPLSARARSALCARLPRAIDEQRWQRAVGGHPWLIARTLERMWDGDSLQAALNHVHRTSKPHISVWHEQVGPRGRALLSQIQPGGLDEGAFDWDGPLAGWADVFMALRCACLIERREGRVYRGPQLALRGWLEGT